ncbi:MAG: hypothetical protein ACOYCD_05345 [Kiritimatiellia bacterium]|jgi:hypothetical protein
MKRWVKILIGIVIVVAVIVGGTYFYLGHAVKTAVNRIGPRVLGVPVELDHAAISLLRGTVDLGGFRIGNPKGFATPHLMTMQSFSVELDTASIMSDTLTIRHIHINDPKITFEQSLVGNNIGALLKQLESQEKKPQPEKAPSAEKPKPDADAPGKKVVIEDFQLRGAQINVSLPGMSDKAVPVPLPPIVMADIGKESGGASITEIITRVIQGILEGVTKAVTASAGLLGDGAKLLGKGVLSVGDAALEAGKVAGDAALEAGKAAGDAALGVGKVAGDAALDAGKAVGAGVQKGVTAAGDAVSGAAGAVSGGAKQLLGGIKGLVTTEGQSEEK